MLLVFVGVPVLNSLIFPKIKEKMDATNEMNRSTYNAIQQKVLDKKVERINSIRKEQGLEEIVHTPKS